MTVGVLIISHDGIGHAMHETAVAALGGCPVEARLLSASRDCDPDSLAGHAAELVAQIDDGDGVLVLTDLYGSTPSNVARRLVGSRHVRVVAGLNLPMLIRVLNYPRLPLDALVAKAVSGGLDGIFAVGPDP